MFKLNILSRCNRVMPSWLSELKTFNHRLPLDRYLASLSVGVTGGFGLWLLVENLRRKRAPHSTEEPT